MIKGMMQQTELKYTLFDAFDVRIIALTFYS